jgi:hypothetical protein
LGLVLEMTLMVLLMLLPKRAIIDMSLKVIRVL